MKKIGLVLVIVILQTSTVFAQHVFISEIAGAMTMGGVGGGGGGTGTTGGKFDNEFSVEMDEQSYEASALLFNAINKENVITFYEHDYAAKVTRLKAINLKKLESRKLELLIQSYQQNKWVPTFSR